MNESNEAPKEVESAADPSADVTPAPAEGPTSESPAPPSTEGSASPESGGDAKPEGDSKNDGDKGRRPKKKKKRSPSNKGERGGDRGAKGDRGQKGGASQFIEDRIDREADHLARDARTVPSSRLRPLGILAQEVRRMAASGDPLDAREARRALVLMKSRVAYLAGREQGRERSALIKVRDFIFKGVEIVTRNHDVLDPQQLRNFLDHIEAFVGYHRFHADERRRD